MATIEFNCPQCGKKLTADRTLSKSITLCPICRQAIRVPQFGLYPEMQLGDFVLKRKLGGGGMGEVWLAEQKSMQREVAVKILSPELADNEDFCRRFQSEAKNSGKLLHPNIVTAFYAGKEDNLHYLAMSYIDGVPLDTELRVGNTIPERQALRIVREVAVALAYAWNSHQIIHRDIKPSNIMLARDGSVKLLDLGISKSIGDNDMLTKTGLFVGTPHYISPEQAKNDPQLNFHSDMYSLGAVLFHMLTGNFPYQATTPIGVVAQHLSEPLPNLREKNPNLSENVCRLVEKMMQKNPQRRFASWEELIRAIDAVDSGKTNRQHLIFLSVTAVVLIAVTAMAVSQAIIAGKTAEAETG
ncbi:MAG: serine/threonine-protein kinase, partial [Victivallales bacterium]|nr:serine/threonine-protein kinase [Victivallales bacterium]